MNVSEYVERVDFHLERLGVVPRPPPEAYVEAWNNQIPARKMAESYKRRLDKERSRLADDKVTGDKVTGPRPPILPAPTSTDDPAASKGG